MRERPVLFSAPMVQAIQRNQKTVTRRIVKANANGGGKRLPPNRVSAAPTDGKWWAEPGGWIESPYGKPGDRLWVRETHSLMSRDVYPCPDVWYRADCATKYDDPSLYADHIPGCDRNQASCWGCAAHRDGKFKWKPAIFMRRQHSRLTLEITDVRVERLHDITEEDAKAEGCSGRDPEPANEGGTIYAWKGRSSAPSPRAHFAHLWDSINSDRANWQSNPWVWVVSFKVGR